MTTEAAVELAAAVEERRTAEEVGRRSAAAELAGEVGRALDAAAGDADALAGEMPALGQRLLDRVRAEEALVAGAVGDMAAAAGGLGDAAARAADGLAAALSGALERAAGRRAAAARMSEETAGRVRDVVEGGATGLLQGVTELAERLRLWEQALQDGAARAEQELQADPAAGAAGATDEAAAAALRDASSHLEQARAALLRQRGAMEGLADVLARGQEQEARLRAALDASLAVEGGGELAAALADQRDSLSATLRGLAAAQPAASGGAAALIERAQRAARDEAAAALALLQAQSAYAQAAAEVQRAGLAGEEGHLRVVAEGRELLAAGAREVAEALRTQAEVLAEAQRLQEAGLGEAGQRVAGIAAALRESLPLIG
jgi:hypothetical protein